MSGLGNHGHVVRDRDRWTPGRRHAPLSPRCGKPLAIYETAGAAVPDKYNGTGQAIRQARQDRGLSQGQLAAAIGVANRKVVGDWETGRRYPRKGTAALERVLGIRLGGPVCCLPEGHPPGCRSQAAVARKYAADVERIAEARRVLGWRYGRPARTEAA